MSAITEKLERLVNAIDETVTDFTTLDVVTVSGKIQSIIVTDGDKKKYLKPIDLIQNYDPANTDIHVEAFTHIDFDQDVIQFYKDGITENDLTYKLHQQAVEASRTARLAVLNFIKEVVK